MGNDSKLKELEFHRNRVSEVSVRFIQSIYDDPELSPEQRLNYLKEIAAVHTDLAAFVCEQMQRAFGAVCSEEATYPVEAQNEAFDELTEENFC